jgi:hypothetical protein
MAKKASGTGRHSLHDIGTPCSASCGRIAKVAIIATHVAASSPLQGVANIWQWKWRPIPKLSPLSIAASNTNGNQHKLKSKCRRSVVTLTNEFYWCPYIPNIKEAIYGGRGEFPKSQAFSFKWPSGDKKEVLGALVVTSQEKNFFTHLEKRWTSWNSDGGRRHLRISPVFGLRLLVEWLTRLTYNPKRVSERVRSRPGHIQKLE